MKIKHRQRWFFCILAAIFLLVSIPVWGAADGFVTGNVVNVRSGAGTSYSIIAKAEAGQRFELLERSGDWQKVTLHTGQVGWMHIDYIQAKEVIKKVIVKGNVVNLRTGPGTGYAKADQVSSGTSLSVYQEKDGWYQVYVNGPGLCWIAGWLVEDAVSSSSYIVVKTEVLNVRSGPGTNYSLATKIGMNEKHAVIQEDNGWYKIAIGSVQGWVSGDYVDVIRPDGQTVVAPNPPDTGGESEGNASEPSNKTVIVNGGVVNVRSAGSLNAQVVAKVYAGERLTVTGQQGDWYQVTLTNGTKGWIASWLTNPEGTPSASQDNSAAESDVLIAPITEGKVFKIVNDRGSPVLVLEGWNTDEYRVRQDSGTENTLILEMDGACERNYTGKVTNLGITEVSIKPVSGKGQIRLTFTFPPVTAVAYDTAHKVARIRVSTGTAQTKELTGKVIVIDPGHASVQPGGWLDPGAIGNRLGLQEKDVNLSVSLKLKTLLENAGARVVMTHAGSTNLSLAGRANVANSINADIFVSVHANYNNNSSIAGHSVYYYAPSSNPVLASQRYSRQKLATMVQREMVKAGGRSDLGTKESNFAVLRETRVPSILIETAYLSNSIEEAMLASDAFRQKLAEGISNGIVAYFK